MGAGASTLDEFGPFGDIDAVKKLCSDNGKEFDQAKFDELKDKDGNVTRDQLQELFKKEAAAPPTIDASGSASNDVVEKPKKKKKQPPRIIISGAPASGKGTQAEHISSEFNVVHLSTGDMLRAEVAKKSPVGLKAQEYMNNGKLVPNEVMIEIVIARIHQPDCEENGWLLDGFPRTDDQAQALNDHGVHCDVFVHLDVPDEALVERVEGRRSDPVTGKIYHMKFNPPPEEAKDRLVQRSDDTAEKVKTRIAAFHENLNPLLTRYKDKTLKVDGNRKADSIWGDLYGSIARSVKFSVVFVLGGPKSGKRSYCKLLSGSFGYEYICPLDLMKERGLAEMTSQEMITMILAEMEKSEASSNKKFIMDAFPRSKDDLREWFDMMGDLCIVDHVVYLETPEEVARERLKEEEPDMSEEVIQARFDDFNQHTLPIITTFQWLGKVRKHTAVSEVSVGFNFLSKFFEKKAKNDEANATGGEGGTLKDEWAPIHHRSLAIIKPDIILKNKETGNVNKMLQVLIDTKQPFSFSDMPISIVSYRLVQMTPEIASAFYEVHKDKPFFSTLIEFMCSGPALVMILDGRDVMRRWREMMGPTDPKDEKANPTCMRALYGTDILHNAVHGSSSEATAFSEIDFWTKEGGLGTSAVEVNSADYGIDIPSSIIMPPYAEHPSSSSEP